MIRFVVSRALQAILVLICVVLVVFSLMFLSGDPAVLQLPIDASPEDLAAYRRQMGLDQPFIVQFTTFVGNLLQGDFGNSWRYQRPALDVVLERLPATVELAVLSLLISLVIAIPVGVLSAVYRNGKIDTVAMIAALLGQSTPTFWLGTMFILLFAVNLGWLPTSGRGGFEHIILPALSLGVFLAGRNARLVRSAMLEVLNDDYVRTARAKGAPELRVINVHALKNALLPVVTMVGLELGSLLGGAVIIESVFSWPGIGLLSVQAVGGRDYPVVQAVIIVAAIIFVVTNLVIDLVYMWLDPRISYERR